MTETSAPDYSPLLPLANVIAETVRDTPVRFGPGGTDALISDLTLKVAAYMGRELLDTPGLARHMVEVDTERQAQLTKWGDQRHPDGTGPDQQILPEWSAGDLANAARDACQRQAEMGVVTWRDIFGEEACEVLAESDPVRLRAELVQVAAVCAAWISDMDRRQADPAITPEA